MAQVCILVAKVALLVVALAVRFAPPFLLILPYLIVYNIELPKYEHNPMRAVRRAKGDNRCRQRLPVHIQQHPQHHPKGAALVALSNFRQYRYNGIEEAQMMRQ